jgi:CRP/FNR family transcriptional regulator
MQDRRKTFEPFPLLERLSEVSRAILSRSVVHLDCKTSEIILRQGQAAAGAFIVEQGRLRVYSLSAGGHEATLYTLERGETCVLALNCLFNDLLYPAWVEAEVDSRVVVIPGQVYRRLFSREPVVQDLTVRSLSTAVFRLMQ